MNNNVNKILDSALKRAKSSESPYDWGRCSTEKKIHIIQLFVGIIILELEMSEHVSDLDLEAIKIVREMTVDEWKGKMEYYEKLPLPTDDFIKSKVDERIKSGYKKIIDLDTGEMKTLKIS